MSETTTPDSPAATPPGGGQWLPVTHQLVRRHDGTVISSHCCGTCGHQALNDATLTQLIGPNSPGPLEWVWADLIDLATGQSAAFTRGMTPLAGEPADVHTWP